MKHFLIQLSLLACAFSYGAICPEGTSNATDGTDDITPCIPCDVGTYADTPGSLSCTLCGVGTFTAFSSSVTCVECAPGMFQDLEGQSSCNSCDPGTYNSDPGAELCTACPLGLSSNSGATTCVASASGGGCAATTPPKNGNRSYDFLFLLTTLYIALSPIAYAHSRLSHNKVSGS